MKKLIISILILMLPLSVCYAREIITGVENKEGNVVLDEGGIEILNEELRKLRKDISIINPSFSVKPTSTQTNIAVGSALTVIWGTEIFDIGGNFASNTFTASQTGKYQLNVSLVMEQMDSAASAYQVFLVTSNRTYEVRVDPGLWDQDGTSYLNISVIADMDINDTAVVKIEQTGGAQQTDVLVLSTFSGSLI